MISTPSEHFTAERDHLFCKKNEQIYFENLKLLFGIIISPNLLKQTSSPLPLFRSYQSPPPLSPFSAPGNGPKSRRIGFHSEQRIGVATQGLEILHSGTLWWQPVEPRVMIDPIFPHEFNWKKIGNYFCPQLRFGPSFGGALIIYYIYIYLPVD